MTENAERATSPSPQNTRPEPTAVIARPGRYDEDWSGRYLHYAPGPRQPRG